MAGDTHGVSERREAKRRSSRSDRSERMAWRWIGYAMLMDMARGREVSDRIERMDSELLRRLTVEDVLCGRSGAVFGRWNQKRRLMLLHGQPFHFCGSITENLMTYMLSSYPPEFSVSNPILFLVVSPEGREHICCLAGYLFPSYDSSLPNSKATLFFRLC